MKRFTSIILVLVLLVSLLTGCAKPAPAPAPATPAPAPAPVAPAPAEKPAETIVLRLSTNHAEDYPTSKGLQEFAKLVDERSKGALKIEIYYSAQLGEEKAAIEQIQFGGLDFARVSISPLSEFSKNMNALQLPYLYRDKEHMWKVLNGPIGDEFLQSIEAGNMIGLNFYEAGARSFYNSKREIKSVSDLNGLKIRVQESQMMMGLVKAVGASPVAMPFNEVYSALQTGVVDGAENNWPSFLSTSHYEVAKFFTLDEHTRVPEMVIASKMTMEKLSQEQQDLITKAAKDSTTVQREAWAAEEKRAEEIITAAGVVVTKLESNQEFQDAVAPLYEEFGGDYKDIIEKIKATK